MNMAYQEPQNARLYLDFLDSADGRIQRDILREAIAASLPESRTGNFLDAAGGSGWLAAALKSEQNRVFCCDHSLTLLEAGRGRYPAVEFSHAELERQLPYPRGFFDAAALNMSGPDLADLRRGMENLAAALKPGAPLAMTVPNPELTYPSAVWKRNWKSLFLGKPALTLTGKTAQGQEVAREFNGGFLMSHHYSLSQYQKAAQEAGFSLSAKVNLKSDRDSRKFDLNYRMFRYPLILLLVFRKN